MHVYVNQTQNAELKFNFGDEPFKNQPKEGYVALNQASDGHVVKSSQTGELHTTFIFRCLQGLYNVSWHSVCHVYLSSGSAKVSQVKSSSNAPRALIIEPSKELAEQTLNNVNQFKKYVDNPKLRWAAVSLIILASFERIGVNWTWCFCRDLLIIGGVAAKEQLSVLESGVRVQIFYFSQNIILWNTKLSLMLN